MVDAIHTINARTDIGLTSAKAHFGISDEAFENELWRSVEVLATRLAHRGVDYKSLKNLLVPRAKRSEVAYLFDWLRIGGTYGEKIAHLWLPALEADTRTSILTGDLLTLRSRVNEFIEPSLRLASNARDFAWDTLYAVYFNNLSRTMAEKLEASFRRSDAYVGHVDATYSSLAKDYFSATLSNSALISQRTAIVNHGADDPVVGTANEIGYAFGAYGLDLVSVQSAFFGPFLTYKIESGVDFGGADRVMGMNAITAPALDVDDFDLFVDESRLTYLRANHLESLRGIGLHELNAGGLAASIRERIGASYVYSLRRLFNIALEFESSDHKIHKRIAAFKLSPAEKRIELVTFI